MGDRMESPGGVQSELFMEGNTCMTSSEDSRVSIPPKRSGIGLTDDRVVFHLSNGHLILWIYTGFSAGNGHRYI